MAPLRLTSRDQLTLEERADPGPARDGALAVVLAEGELHEEEWYAGHEQHDDIRDEEGTCPSTVLVINCASKFNTFQ